MAAAALGAGAAQAAQGAQVSASGSASASASGASSSLSANARRHARSAGQGQGKPAAAPVRPYAWHAVQVDARGRFSCQAGYAPLFVEKLKLVQASKLEYAFSTHVARREGVLDAKALTPEQHGYAAMLAQQLLQHAHVRALCVKPAPDDALFDYMHPQPYAWSHPRRLQGGKLGDCAQPLHALSIDALERAPGGRIRYAISGAGWGQSMAGTLDTRQPSKAEVRFSSVLLAHVGRSIPQEGLRVCVQAQDDDPLFARMP